MSTLDPARDADRLRSGPRRPPRLAHVDAEISIPPRFPVLLAIAFGCALVQSTLLAGVELRGAHVSLLLVLVVWTGLRCGVVTGGWLGFFAGLFADALGGGGVNVIGFTLAGFTTQSFFLAGLGIDHEMQTIAGGDANKFARLAGEARQLMMPGEMGERFKAMAWLRGLELPLAGFALQDLRHTL